ncbi:MAG: HupE/UreJ family protein [Thermoanaerobaculia bacterium]|nr:HupE/UreJ family protein [Thermoanaerobaculia bacterium]
MRWGRDRLGGRGGAVLALLGSSVLPAPVLAHVGPGEVGGFLTGLGHPVSGLDHVLAMVAVGVWGAQLSAPAIWMLPVAFPMTMAVGGLLALLGLPLPAVEVGIALSAVALGGLVLGRVRPPLALALAIVGAFALFHGHAHGTELPAGESAVLYSLGFVISTGLLHAGGIAIGLVERWPVGHVLLRLAGLVVLLGGLYFLLRAVG